ncbi:MAG: amylo-alpha-1,6-glucosidase [Phycisphaerales bacterium]
MTAASTIPTAGEPLHRMSTDSSGPVGDWREIEWVLPDGLGGFAMGTALGVNTRRYHGWLVHATKPPVGRLMLLNACVEQLVLKQSEREPRTIDLSSFEFAGGRSKSDGPSALTEFRKGVDFVEWRYSVDAFVVKRRLRIGWRRGGLELSYRIDGPDAEVRLRVAPLVRLADMHHLFATERKIESVEVDDGVVVRDPNDESAEVAIFARDGSFRVAPDWWRGFHYEQESRRGQDDLEHLYTPGWFTFEWSAGSRSRSAVVRVEPNSERARRPLDTDDRSAHLDRIVRAAGEITPALANRPWLLSAADDFVVPRTVDGVELKTILAGYPWFTDWGRDTMISLPGLLLVTRRFDEALATLRVFAKHQRRGLIPNLFDDTSGAAHYNTVDASLWFVHAATEYRRLSANHEAYLRHLHKPCLDILTAYRDGTDFGIRMDPEDALVTAGDESTQLTWMDAARDGVVFTPRFGKAIEINALWYHGLRAVAEAMVEVDATTSRALQATAERAGRSIRELFWSDRLERLADTLRPTVDDGGRQRWEADFSIRPNMLFAVSLRHSALTDRQRRAVVAMAHRELLTPKGMRTLSPGDERYRSRFEGDMFSRDGAYHQGTVWPWLMGCFVEALLRSEGFSDSARSTARRLANGLIEEMEPPECPSVGQLYEVYDGAHEPPERPQRPGGCTAQAWSVAELVRAIALVESPELFS